MVELLLVLAGAIVGFAIAWFFGGKTREQLAEARVKLSQTELRLQETQIMLTGTKADLSEATLALNARSAMRAAAEALNARVPQLENGEQRMIQEYLSRVTTSRNQSWSHALARLR